VRFFRHLGGGGIGMNKSEGQDDPPAPRGMLHQVMRLCNARQASRSAISNPAHLAGKALLRSSPTASFTSAGKSLLPRKFSRAFRAETGKSPVKMVENLRVESARLLMEQGRLSMDTIADETGFADCERMWRAFLRAFGQSSQAVCRNSR